MQNTILDFLGICRRHVFAIVDFEHYLNRKGIAIPRQDVERMLAESGLVSTTKDGTWEKVPPKHD